MGTFWVDWRLVNTHHLQYTSLSHLACHKLIFTNIFVTYLLYRTYTVTRTLTQFFRNFDTRYLKHTSFFACHICLTSSFLHLLPHTHTHTQLFRNIGTHHLSHISLSHIIRHMQSSHTQLFTYKLPISRSSTTSLFLSNWKKLTCGVIRPLYFFTRLQIYWDYLGESSVT